VRDVFVAIDIGTSKVCTAIGRVSETGRVEILGKGTEPCSGVKKGVIINIENTSNAISSSIKKAESMSNMKVESAFVNIIGSHVCLISKRSSVIVSGENHEISKNDVEALMYEARCIPLTDDEQIVDIIPQQYIIDGYDEIIDPIGMFGTRLEVEADIVTGKITSVQNIIKSVEKAGIKVAGIVVEALATSSLMLTSDEKEMGVILLDIGGGVTDISVFRNKKLLFYDSIPVGGDHITNDLSIGLKTSYAEADKIKKEYDIALMSLVKNDQEFTIIDIDENKRKTVKVSEVVEIIEARVYEIFSLAKEMLEKAGISENLRAGVVLTGRGIAYIDGSNQLTQEVFGLSSRVASAKASGVADLEFATAGGILKYVAASPRNMQRRSQVKVANSKKSKKSSNFLEKIFKFFGNLF
jgi:cell division protein FtsA